MIKPSYGSISDLKKSILVFTKNSLFGIKWPSTEIDFRV